MIDYSVVFHASTASLALLAITLPPKMRSGPFHWSAYDERMFLRLALVFIAILLECGYWVGRFINHVI